MNGKKDSPSTGQETSGIDSCEQFDVQVSRLEVSSTDHGSRRASIKPGGPISGEVQLTNEVDEVSVISVTGYLYDDEEPNVVECFMTIGSAGVRLSFPPERAREFAEELRLAADCAQEEVIEEDTDV